MLGDLVFELNVELDETIHGYCNAASFDDHDLNPSILVAPKSSEKGHTQTCAKAGFKDSRQYLPVA